MLGWAGPRVVWLRCWVKEGALCVRWCEQPPGASLGDTGSTGSRGRAGWEVTEAARGAVSGGARGHCRWARLLGPSPVPGGVSGDSVHRPLHTRAGQDVSPALRGRAGARPAGREH